MKILFVSNLRGYDIGAVLIVNTYIHEQILLTNARQIGHTFSIEPMLALGAVEGRFKDFR